MKHAYLITFLTLVFCSTLLAQPVFRGAAVQTGSPEAFRQQFSEYQLFRADASALKRYARGASGPFELQLQAGDAYTWNLALEAHDIRPEHYQLVAFGPQGKELLPRTENKTFRGTVLGPQGGEARLAIDDHFIYGFVESAGETYYIEPARTFDPELGEDIYVAYPSRAVANFGQYKCGWEEESRPDVHELPAPEAGRVIQACYQVDIALAADFSMVQAYGSVNGAESFMLGVLNNVQSNYDNEFNNEILFAVSTIYVSTCSNCDPWTDSRSAGSLLDDFAFWGNTGGFAANFDVASLWTNRDFFGDAIGVAWVGSVCTGLRYNILQRFSTNAALLRVLQAHELGHNFDASHDFPGSNFIMAPSVNNSNNWSNFSRTRINSFVNSLAAAPGCLAACGSVAPPSPALTASVTGGCAPLVVNFSDVSTGQVDNISWQFPGGTPSSSSNPFPTVTYNTPGIYDVILTVANSGGANTITMDDYITVDLGSVPQFSYTVNGLAVSFTNTSTNAQTYQWSFGDGDFSNELNPVHTYAADGLYLVTLTTSNVCGPVTFEEFIIVEQPMQAGLSAGTTLDCAGSTVAFSDQSTGAPVDWQWTFDGGTPSVSDSQNPSVTYENAGVYDVSLTVTNAVGTQSTFSLPGYIAVLPGPEADFTYQYTAGGLDVQFNSTSVGADSYTWDFGDGASSNAQNPSHSYTTDGNYTVTLTIDSQCGTDEVVQNIEVATPPSAAFSAGVLSGCAPLEVQFNNESTANATDFQWFFQGGAPTSSTEPNPVVQFSAPGSYFVTLVSGNVAGSDTITQDFLIEGGPQSAFDIDYTIGDTGASFTNQSSNADSVRWLFSGMGISTEDNPSFDFGTDGTYQVTLIAINDCGNDTLVQQIDVVTPPQAEIGLASTVGCAPFTVQPSGLSSSNTTSWSWTAPGATPNTSDASNPSFTFTTAGNYTIVLEAANAAGTSTDTVTVRVGDVPMSGFTATIVLGETALSLSNDSQDADSYFWNLGDGSTSTDAEPVYTYSQDGTYTIELVATNACGNDTSSQEVTVITAPAAAFELDGTVGCAPFTVQASDLSGSNTTSWSWTAPGATPNTSDASNPSFTFTTAGNYTIVLEAGNAAGTSTDTVTVRVGDVPTSAFTATTVLGETTLSLSNDSQDADSYFWNLGDGSTSTDAEPAYNYSQDGTYTIELVATNACGNDTSSQEVTVITAPAAAFELDGTVGCAPFTVQASDLSSSNTTSWSWTAPGAAPNTSDVSNPSFTFAAAGNYTIVLEAANAAGTSTDTVTVRVGDVPTSAFTATTVLGEATLSLSNDSQDADSYFWNLGDGSTSSDAEPAYTYTQDGTYTIELVATNACGNDTSSQEVTVITAPAAAFELDGTVGCAPFTVQASDLSSSNTTSWSWTAPGATPNTSDASNPSFTFAAAGNYTIVLEAANAAGTSTDTVTVRVGDVPTSAFTATTVLGEATLSLSNDSQDADSYFWNLGDGSTSSDAEPAYTYSQDGTYTIELVATNACGNDTSSQEVTIVTAPAAAFELDGTVGCAPFTVQASDLSSSNTTSWNWTAPGATPNTSDEQNPSFTFTAPGTYTLTLEASNAAGTSQDVLQVVVNGSPEPGFTPQVNGPEVQFLNTSGNSLNYTWDFGDGSSSEAANPVHIYDEPGQYTVTLTAANECGMVTVTEEITINLESPVASFNVTDNEGCAPLLAVFENASDNAESFSWSFPGGTPSTSTEPNPTVTYETPGVYSVTLTAINAAGSGALTRQDIIVVGGPPQSSFSYVADEATVFFTNTANDADSYLWLFGDGNSSDAIDPQYTYAQGGEYTVLLIATNECGTDTTEQMITLTGMAPMPNLAASVETGCAPLSVTFDGGVQETVGSWQWAFPGGVPATSSDPNPTVVYEQPGVYDVQLTVSNAFGENSQEEVALITVIDVPEASFDYDIQELTLLLGNTSTGAGLSYNWDFGDGSGSTEENPEHTYAEAGEYTVVLTVANACGEAVAEETVVAVTSSLVDESWLEELSLFPNPNKGAFTVRLQGQPASRLQLNLRNVVGQRVFGLEDSFHTGYWQEQLAVGQLPAGVYVLEVVAGERRAYRRVVVE